MSKNIVIKIYHTDNVAVALCSLNALDTITVDNKSIILKEDIPKNFKIAIDDIKKGESVIKYGYPIGVASDDIKKGSLVHTHNVKSLLSGKKDYDITFKPNVEKSCSANRKFWGFLRENGDIGIRNEIFIIPTVGCVNDLCRKIAEKAILKTNKKDIHVFTHPYGCSQLGDDHVNTQIILKGLAEHPNAGGVLVVSLGCENNNLSEFKKVLGEYNPERVKFITAQDSGDEIEEGVNAIAALSQLCEKDERTEQDISMLKLGLKCGGSDALSGITANPLVGVVCDKLSCTGAGVVMTEVPEMFGAEQILMNRSLDENIYKQIIDMINNFKDYYIKHGESVGENPSPGNKEGGITTLEEKSLGCIQKGGNSAIHDVLKYGEKVKARGLSLLDGPGNDIIAQTALAVSGVHIILFTTGRGTPLGAAVPTIKISTNSELAEKKPNWIDFDAGKLLKEDSIEDLSEKLLDLIEKTANGENTKNEINGYRDFAIWKNGVTL